MRPARTAAFILVTLLPFAAVSATAATPTDRRTPARLLTLVNASFDSVSTVAIAPAGSADFHDVALGEPLQGGLTSATIHVPDGDCLRDMRATFSNGRTHLFPGIDVCRYHGLRLTAQRLDPERDGLGTQRGIAVVEEVPGVVAPGR